MSLGDEMPFLVVMLCFSHISHSIWLSADIVAHITINGCVATSSHIPTISYILVIIIIIIARHSQASSHHYLIFRVSEWIDMRSYMASHQLYRNMQYIYSRSYEAYNFIMATCIVMMIVIIVLVYTLTKHQRIDLLLDLTNCLRMPLNKSQWQ